MHDGVTLIVVVSVARRDKKRSVCVSEHGTTIRGAESECERCGRVSCRRRRKRGEARRGEAWHSGGINRDGCVAGVGLVQIDLGLFAGGGGGGRNKQERV